MAPRKFDPEDIEAALQKAGRAEAIVAEARGDLDFAREIRANTYLELQEKFGHGIYAVIAQHLNITRAAISSWARWSKDDGSKSDGRPTDSDGVTSDPREPIGEEVAGE